MKIDLTREELGELYNATINLQHFCQSNIRSCAADLNLEGLRNWLDRIEKIRLLTKKLNKKLWPDVVFK